MTKKQASELAYQLRVQCVGASEQGVEILSRISRALEAFAGSSTKTRKRKGGAA